MGVPCLETRLPRIGSGLWWWRVVTSSLFRARAPVSVVQAPLTFGWAGLRWAGAAGGHDGGVRIVIAEDQFILRQGLSALLAPWGIQTVAAGPDAASALRACAELAPDLALLDIRMPPTHRDEGLRAALELRRGPLASLFCCSRNTWSTCMCRSCLTPRAAAWVIC